MTEPRAIAAAALTAGLALAAGLAIADGADDDPRKVRYRETPPGDWSARAGGDPAAAPATGVLRLTWFAGTRRLGPLLAAGGGVLALDVDADFAACADGSLRIRTLRIGGVGYALDERCLGEQDAAAAPVLLRCDPDTRRCEPGLD